MAASPAWKQAADRKPAPSVGNAWKGAGREGDGGVGRVECNGGMLVCASTCSSRAPLPYEQPAHSRAGRLFHPNAFIPTPSSQSLHPNAFSIQRNT